MKRCWLKPGSRFERGLNEARWGRKPYGHSPEALAPFIVYLATDEAAYISGTVFGVGGSGLGFTNEVSIYSEPVPKKVIQKEAGLWTVDELVETVPKTLLE